MFVPEGQWVDVESGAVVDGGSRTVKRVLCRRGRLGSPVGTHPCHAAGWKCGGKADEVETKCSDDDA